MKDKDRMTQ